MKKNILSLLLLLCLICLTACNRSSNPWYNPKEIKYFGQTKDDIITSLKTANIEYTESSNYYEISLSNPVTIDGNNYTIYFSFCDEDDNYLLRSVTYVYKADTTSSEDAFKEIKKQASILTKKYGDPYTDIFPGTNDPTIASLETYANYLEKPQGLCCYDIWLLSPRKNRISCTLSYGNDENSSSIYIRFDKLM